MFAGVSLSAKDYEQRTWTSHVGTKLEATLVREAGDSVVLRRPDGSELTVQLEHLSRTDRDYVEEATEVRGETRVAGLDAEPGKISEKISCADEPRWHYYLYLPKDFHDARKWPVWFIMAPGGGNNPGPMQRYIDGAERLGCILAFSVESKNGFADSDVAIHAMVEDVYDRLPAAEDLAFSSGMSGGSRMAYLLAEQERNIAGVLACGSGSGVYIKDDEFREAKLRGSTYVYSLMGTNCFNRTGAFQSHDEFPDEYRLRFFPGKHDWADADLIEEGMARVLGAGLANYDGDDAEKMRSDYAKTMWDWTLAMVGKRPWEAHYWATFLSEFPGPRSIQGDAGTLADQLENNPKVELARDAEEAILDFADDYFHVYYKEDQKPNPDRKEDAEELAEKFKGVPHAEILRRLGDPS